MTVRRLHVPEGDIDVSYTPTLYEIVYGPRSVPSQDSFLYLLDRALEANTVMARSAALAGDHHGEALHHSEINKLLTIRETDEQCKERPR